MHRLENIANRPIPLPGTELKPIPGEIVEVEMIPEIELLIKNKFFKDLGKIKKVNDPIKANSNEFNTEFKSKKKANIGHNSDTKSEYKKTEDELND